jgi:hypothetical protein
MRSPGKARRTTAMVVLALGAVISLGLQGVAATASEVGGGGGRPMIAVHPRPYGELDCNGLSPVQHAIKANLACADPRGSRYHLGSWGRPGAVGRFYENGHYIGHDEPSVRFLSSQPGSGNNFSMTETIPSEPKALPTVKHPGSDVTHWFELSLAPWFSITVCDPHSAPLLPCTAESDSNAPSGSYPGAGAAFVELQFYPPGFAPFQDNISCDNTHWCSALNIDSLECTGNGSGACNPDCTEPVNFAFVQRGGVPTGPPNPQKSDFSTFQPNSKTLLMNPGDKVKVQMFDASLPAGGHALEVKESDLTTGQTGFMIASGANGFQNTNPFTCKGTKFNFQPEYNTAAPQNIIPWGIGPYMLNDEYEIGHFEACTKISGKETIHLTAKRSDTYYKECSGPYEKAKDTAEKFEPNDAPCYPKGDTHGGLAAPNLVTGCDVFFDAIGDLDYDGSPYYPDWPNKVTPDNFPAPFLQQQPTTVSDMGYPWIQFVTDTTATEFNTNCNLTTGAGCVMPPKGPGKFYPYFTESEVSGNCVWEFGNMTNGNDFGQEAQYGSVGPDSIGAFTSSIMSNPNCSG